MVARRHATVQIELLRLQEEPETGLWCDACALPSVIQLTYLARLNGREHGLLRVAACADCGKVTDG